MSEAGLTISTVAAVRIKRIMSSRIEGSMLRIEVIGGGCSGFSYRFDIVESAGDGDTIFENDGARIVVDQVSLPYLTGSSVDFAEELIGSAFRVDNPKARAACGCGVSFSL